MNLYKNIALSAIFAFTATAAVAKTNCINNQATEELKTKLNDVKSSLSKEAQDYVDNLQKAIKKYQYQLGQEGDKKGYDQDIYCQIALTTTFVDELDKLVKSISTKSDIIVTISEKQNIIEEGIKLIQNLEASLPVQYPEACASTQPPQGTTELVGQIGKGYKTGSVAFYVNYDSSKQIKIDDKVGVIGNGSPWGKGYKDPATVWVENYDPKKLINSSVVCVGSVVKL